MTMIISWHPVRQSAKSHIVAVANGSTDAEIVRRMDYVMAPSSTTAPSLADFLAGFDLAPTSSRVKKVRESRTLTNIFNGAFGNMNTGITVLFFRLEFFNICYLLHLQKLVTTALNHTTPRGSDDWFQWKQMEQLQRP